MEGLPICWNEHFSWKPKDDPRGLPIALLSICSYITLLKLKSTEQVSNSINSIKIRSWMGGQSKGPLCKVS